MKISIIVAASMNNVIAKDGQIPWHISADMKHFREITTGHHVLMGRKTFESIGKPLPGRTNLVLSRNKEFKKDGIIVFEDFGDAIRFARDRSEDELIIIGGEQVYKFSLPLVEKIYMTRILRNIDGQTKFTEIDSSKWTETARELHTNGEEYEFRTLERK